MSTLTLASFLLLVFPCFLKVVGNTGLIPSCFIAMKLVLFRLLASVVNAGGIVVYFPRWWHFFLFPVASYFVFAGTIVFHCRLPCVSLLVA